MTTPTPAPAPLPPPSSNALDALLIVTKRWLDACHSTMRAHGYGHEIPYVPGVFGGLTLKDGMRTRQSCGWEQAKRGLTTLDEVLVYAERSV